MNNGKLVQPKAINRDRYIVFNYEEQDSIGCIYKHWEEYKLNKGEQDFKAFEKFFSRRDRRSLLNLKVKVRLIDPLDEFNYIEIDSSDPLKVFNALINTSNDNEK